MSQPLILVTGANGRTGRAILAALRDAGAATRAFLRDAAQISAIQAIGTTEWAVGDLDRPEDLVGAAAGCRTIIHIGPPMHPREVEHTANILAAARHNGVERLIYYSVMHPLRREVRHHRLKLDAEEHVVEGGVPYTILQPIRYMQHLEPIWPTVLRENVHAMPYNIDIGFNVVDLADLAAATAKVALDASYNYATFELAGPEALSQRDMGSILSEELGRPITARAIPLDELAANARARGVTEERITQMRTMNDHYDRFGFLGNPKILTWILDRPPTNFRAYVRRLIGSHS